MHTLKILVASLLVAVISCGSALAHEFLIKPGKTSAAVGESVRVSVASAHVFIVSEELEDAANVKISAMDASGVREVALSPDQKTLTYEGKAAFGQPGWGMVLGHRLPEVWTKTPSGMKKGTKADFPGASISNMYEKFCKTLVLVGKPNDAWKKQVGHKLEIVPISDPAGFKAGREASFQILFEGKPLSTEVLATYDGCTKTPNSYAWYTEADDKGVARVKFSSKGLWLVRVQHKAPGKNGVTEHVMRSALLFNVK